MSDDLRTQYRNKNVLLKTQYLPQCYIQLKDIMHNFYEIDNRKRYRRSA